MEKASRNLTVVLILTVFVVVVGATVKRGYDEHNEKSLRVVSQKIEEAGELCFRDGVCKEETTLGFLVEKDYISLPVHPISKEYVALDTKVTCQNFDCSAVVK